MANWLAHLGRLAEATLHGLERASIAVSRVLNLAGGLHAISHSCPSGQHLGYNEAKDDRRRGIILHPGSHIRPSYSSTAHLHLNCIAGPVIGW